MSTLIGALLDAIFASLAEATGLSDWLRQRLGREPERLVFGAALTQALTDVANEFPGRDLRYFAEMLPQFAGPLLARYLQPAASPPTADELTHRWLNHLTIDSAIIYRQEFAAFATHFLDRLVFHLENQEALQWVVQARRQRSNEEATQRMAVAAEKGAAGVEALQQEFENLAASLEAALQANGHSTIYTGGGAYIDGNVRAQNFAGRDLTIKNYFVQGLPRLVIDYSSRIQDFLLEYLGSKRKRVPFGGRQQQLAELDAWLNDPTAPPYYLMSAEAGRGKSALVCRWLAQLTTRSDLDVIFIPISIRFETATQDVVFAALAARLSNLHENEPEKLLPVSLTAEQWKSICQSYLRRDPPEKKQLLIILDGLDEATGWSPGPGLFGSDPPEGLHILVTARTRPGESHSDSWVNILSWGDSRLARTATLLPLGQHGVEEVLVSMGNPLDKLATQVDVVGELYRLSEGDPLLIRLYVDALIAQYKIVHQLKAEDLQSIQPGLAGYFERWWVDQQEQWRLEGRDPIVEQGNLRTLLSAIAAAMGPLTFGDLASLHSSLAESMVVRRLVRYVNRWLVGDGKEQGYSFGHPRLGYHFWEQLGQHEQEEWNKRFCNWGGDIIESLNGDRLIAKTTSRYLIQHYSAHLERSNAPAKQFYALISNGWRAAWEELEISHVNFLNDIGKAAKAAQQNYQKGKANCRLHIIQQVKAALCYSSVASLSRKIQPELMALAVKFNIFPPLQALAITKLLPIQERSERLIALLPHLPIGLFNETLSTANTIDNKLSRIRVLVRFISWAPVDKEEFVRSECYRLINMITDITTRTSALAELAPYLNQEMMNQVYDDIIALENENNLSDAILTVAPYLSFDQLRESLNKVDEMYHVDIKKRTHSKLLTYMPSKFFHNKLVDISKNDKEDGQVSSLLEYIPYFSESQISEAVNIIKTFKSKDNYYRTLREISPYLSESILEAITVQAISSADHERSANLFLATAKYLPPNSLGALLKVEYLRNKEYATDFATIIEEIASRLPQNMFDEALNIINQISSESARARALAGVANHAPQLLFRDLLKSSTLIEDVEIRYNTLVSLSKNVPKNFEHYLIEISEQTINEHKLQSKGRSQSKRILSLTPILQNLRSKENRHLVSNLTEAHGPKTQASAQQTQIDVSAVKDNFTKVKLWLDIIPSLSDVKRILVIDQALTTANFIQEQEKRSMALEWLSPFTQNFQDQIVSVLKSSYAINDGDYQIAALLAITPYLDNASEYEMYKKLDHIKDESIRSTALTRLAPYLTEFLLAKSLSTVYQINNERIRYHTLINLIPYFSENLIKDSIENVTSFSEERIKSRLLITLAPYCTDSMHQKALNIIRSFSNEFVLADTLAWFIPHLSAPLIDNAYSMAQSIWDIEARTQLLQSFTKNHCKKQKIESPIPPNLHSIPPDISLESICRIRDDYRRLTAITNFVHHALEEEKFPSTVNYSALSICLNMLSTKPRTTFLKELSALVPLLLAFAGDEAPQAAEGIYHAIQEVCGWWP